MAFKMKGGPYKKGTHSTKSTMAYKKSVMEDDSALLNYREPQKYPVFNMGNEASPAFKQTDDVEVYRKRKKIIGPGTKEVEVVKEDDDKTVNTKTVKGRKGKEKVKTITVEGGQRTVTKQKTKKTKKTRKKARLAGKLSKVESKVKTAKEQGYTKYEQERLRKKKARIEKRKEKVDKK